MSDEGERLPCCFLFFSGFVGGRGGDGGEETVECERMSVEEVVERGGWGGRGREGRGEIISLLHSLLILTDIGTSPNHTVN